MEIEIITFVFLQHDYCCSNFRLLFFWPKFYCFSGFLLNNHGNSTLCLMFIDTTVGFLYLLGYMPIWWSEFFVWKCRQMWKLMLLDSQRREHLRSLASEEWILMRFLTCPWMNLSNFSMPVLGEGNIIHCFNIFALPLGICKIPHTTLHLLLPCSVCTYFLVVLGTCERFYYLFFF